MTEIKIEKGVQMPERFMGRKNVYPFPEMEVGDSFHIESSRAKIARAAAGQYAKKFGGKFSVVSEKDGHRVWRVA